MLVTYDSKDATRPIDSALLRHIGESIRAKVNHRKHLHRIRKSTAAVDAEISTLRRVVWQIQALRSLRRPLRPLDKEKMAALALLSNELLRDSEP